MCGMLHCTHLNEKLAFWFETLSRFLPTSTVYDERGKTQTCSGAVLDVGLDYHDPGMTPQGAKCDFEKVRTDKQTGVYHSCR